MATIYCRSTDGNDADNGSTWALAKATLAAALTAAGDGGLVYVSQAHAESSDVNIAITGGSAGSPIRVLCVNDGAEPPTALATTATVSCTAQTSITFEGFMYIYGVTFNAGTGSGTGAATIVCCSGSPGFLFFENSTLAITGTDTGSVIHLGALVTSSPDDSKVMLRNTNMSFGATAQYVNLRSGNNTWEGGSVTGATFPTSLFGGTTGMQGRITLRGVDLSALGSNALVNGASVASIQVNIQNCKLHSSAAIITGTIVGQGGVEVNLENSDSQDPSNYPRFAYYTYEGSTIQATNCKLNADYSMKMVSLATGAKYYSQLISPKIVQWNSSVGTALKATVEIISTATLKNDEIWLEIEYLGTSGYPTSSFANDKHEHHIVSLVSGTGQGDNQDTSTAAWTEDLTSEVKQKLIVTSFTPQEAGYVIGRVYLAKANQTVYVDPHLTIEAA